MADDVSPPAADPHRRAVGWGLAPCLVIALLCALVPLSTSLALGAPWWVGLVTALAVFPGLPLLWHLVAERRRPLAPGHGSGLLRLGLRFLAVGLLVLLVSVVNLGPRRVLDGVVALVRPTPAAKPAAPAKPMAPAGEKVAPVAKKPAPRHELEPFIPADASAVVAVSDPTLVGHVLSTIGGASEDAVAGLEKCQIKVQQARLLIASRDPNTRILVLRAPGVTDPRNLYCLAGFLGSERVRLRFSSDKPPIRFRLAGLLPNPLEFTALDETTLVAKEGAWDGALENPLFVSGQEAGQGPLGAIIARVDRSAGAWVAGLFATERGIWDLALDTHVDAEQLRIAGTSIPPTGPDDQAAFETRVPLTFARALPGAAFPQGLRALGAVLATADGAAARAVPAPPSPGAGPDAAAGPKSDGAVQPP